MDLYRVMEMGLVNSLGSLFDTAQYLVCKSRRDHAPYTLAFWDHFLGIDTTNHRSVDAAVRDSAAFEHWLSQKLETGKIRGELDYQKLIDEFLNETLKSDLSKNIQEEIDAREHLAKDNPDLVDRGIEPPPGAPPNVSDKMVDYSGIPLEELKERMKRVMEQQKLHIVEVDTGLAVMVIHPMVTRAPDFTASGRRTFPCGNSQEGSRGSGILPSRPGCAHHRRQYGCCPAGPEAPQRHPSRSKLDVPMTSKKAEKTLVLSSLFSQGTAGPDQDHADSRQWREFHVGSCPEGPETILENETEISQDLKTFYFHNAVYDQVYEDEARRKPVLLRSVKENSPEYRVFFVGDAYMGPHELLSPYGSIEFREESPVPSLNNLKELHHHFPYMVWINPTPKQYWNRTVAPYINEVMHMEPLTINGILGAARHLEQIRHY